MKRGVQELPNGVGVGPSLEECSGLLIEPDRLTWSGLRECHVREVVHLAT